MSEPSSGQRYSSTQRQPLGEVVSYEAGSGIKFTPDPTRGVTKIETVYGAGAFAQTGQNLNDLDDPTASPYPYRHGVDQRTATFSYASGVLTVTYVSDWDWWYQGVKSTVYDDLTVALDSDRTYYYVYLDADGTLTATDTPWVQTSETQVFVALVYRLSSSVAAIGDERHSSTINRGWHAWAHETIGCRYNTEGGGLTGSFTDTTFTVTAGEIYDEDLLHSISQQTACRRWYRYTGGAAMTFDDNQTTVYKLNGTNIQYDNSGTLTDAANQYYVNYWVYATNDQDYPIYSVVGQTQSATLAGIRDESPPGFANITEAEWKLLYRVTYRNTGSPPTYTESADYRYAIGVPANFVPVDHGSLSGLSDDDHPQYVLHTEVDDSPVESATDVPISSNWAYDHNQETPHQQQEANTVYAGPETDPSADLIALLHLDGTEGSTTITDEKGTSWTAAGDASLTTSGQKLGTACLTLDGTGDYIYSAHIADHNLSTLNWVWECYAKWDATSGQRVLFEIRNSGDNARAVFDTYAGNFRFQVVNASEGLVINLAFATGTITTGTWYHVLLSRSGSSWYCFKDGVQVGTTATDATAMPDYTGNYYIGYEAVYGAIFIGDFDEHRFRKNVAVTSPFTPPSSPYTDSATEAPTFRALVAADIPDVSAQTDHGELTGLADDDHTQYIKHALATAENDFLVASGSGAFVKKTLAETGAILEADLDHGNLQGLSDDDHTQYILKTAFSADGDFLVGTGSGTFAAESGSTARNSLGLGTAATYNAIYYNRGDPSANDKSYTGADFTADGNWHSMDLSSIVGSGAFAVHIRGYLQATAAGVYAQFRAYGASNVYNNLAVSTQVANVYIYYDGLVAVPVSRYIDYRITLGGATLTELTLLVRGWIF